MKVKASSTTQKCINGNILPILWSRFKANVRMWIGIMLNTIDTKMQQW